MEGVSSTLIKSKLQQEKEDNEEDDWTKNKRITNKGWIRRNSNKLNEGRRTREEGLNDQYEEEQDEGKWDEEDENDYQYEEQEIMSTIGWKTKKKFSANFAQISTIFLTWY